MKNTVKFLSLLLATLCTFTFFTACHNESTTHIYTESIVCDAYSYDREKCVFDNKSLKGENYVVLDYVEGMEITLLPQAYPLDATILEKRNARRNYPYIFHTSSDCVIVDERGVVTFTKPGTATIRISPADRSDIYTTVLIRAKEIKN